jgi:hypothetical protein
LWRTIKEAENKGDTTMNLNGPGFIEEYGFEEDDIEEEEVCPFDSLPCDNKMRCVQTFFDSSGEGSFSFCRRNKNMVML